MMDRITFTINLNRDTAIQRNLIIILFAQFNKINLKTLFAIKLCYFAGIAK